MENYFPRENPAHFFSSTSTRVREEVGAKLDKWIEQAKEFLKRLITCKKSWRNKKWANQTTNDDEWKTSWIRVAERFPSVATAPTQPHAVIDFAQSIQKSKTIHNGSILRREAADWMKMGGGAGGEIIAISLRSKFYRVFCVCIEAST